LNGRGHVFGSLSRTRTCDRSINSRLLYQLSYQGLACFRDAHITSPRRLCKALTAADPLAMAGKHTLRWGAILCIGGGQPWARCGRGLVAEWLRRGLQILLSRFDSGRGLQPLFQRLTRIKTQTVLPCAEPPQCRSGSSWRWTDAMRKVDGWQSFAEAPTD
jgi:hypothetical protein